MSTINVISTARRRVVAARRRVRRWGSDCHAAVAIEFVLIIPMLVGLIAFGNEAVGVRLQQKVLQDFSDVASQAIEVYYKKGPSVGGDAGDKSNTRSRGVAVTSGAPASGLNLLSLKELTDGLRVLLAEIHPVGKDTRIDENPCSREATVLLDTDNPFTCQIFAMAPSNQSTLSTLAGTSCGALPEVWDTIACNATTNTIRNPTPCTGSGDGGGYRITWQFGYDTDGSAKKVCKCADTFEVEGITIYDDSVLSLANPKKGTNGGFNELAHQVPIPNPPNLPDGSMPLIGHAGVGVWAASARKGLFTGILNPDTARRLTVQHSSWVRSLGDPTKSTYEAAGLAHVDTNGDNLMSCYATGGATTTGTGTGTP